MSTKRCSKCKQDKSVVAFSKDLSTSDGIRRYCRSCAKIYCDEYREKNHVSLNALQKKRRELDPERHRERVRRSDLKHRFNITPEDKDARIRAQEGRCAICKDPFISAFHTHVDHKHGTNPILIRGILCSKCNTGLGQFKDSSLRCFLAASYLQKFGS